MSKNKLSWVQPALAKRSKDKKPHDCTYDILHLKRVIRRAKQVMNENLAKIPTEKSWNKISDYYELAKIYHKSLRASTQLMNLYRHLNSEYYKGITNNKIVGGKGLKETDGRLPNITKNKGKTKWLSIAQTSLPRISPLLVPMPQKAK